jgi:hypothetical protein
MVKVKREFDFVRLLTHDLFSLNFPVSDYMLIPSFTDPYSYHAIIRIDLRCVSPEIYNNFAEFTIYDSKIYIIQEDMIRIKISIHKDAMNALPAITKYLLKLIHVLCYEQPS